jgi:hypothetical protein
VAWWVVYLVDLDGFEGVDDRTGHAAGDAVLQAVTAALSAVVRETDMVARPGDEGSEVLGRADQAMYPVKGARRQPGDRARRLTGAVLHPGRHRGSRLRSVIDIRFGSVRRVTVCGPTGEILWTVCGVAVDREMAAPTAGYRR